MKTTSQIIFELGVAGVVVGLFSWGVCTLAKSEGDTSPLYSVNDCQHELKWLKHDLEYKQKSVKRGKDMLDILELDKYIEDKEYLISMHSLKLKQDERDVAEIEQKMSELACNK